jgi:NAD-dependent SIR2 family protein deacetylase
MKDISDALAGKIAQATKLISEADAILITAGAGMGVDSGLPDFRGDDGFWNAYPALAKSNVKFYDIASSSNFEHDPKLAWGFYGHRLNLYRNTKPHAGFRMLRELAANKKHGYFVFTSNVDGQFRKAGFDPRRICECLAQSIICNASMVACIIFGMLVSSFQILMKPIAIS